ncbi:carbohydrate ABC transporter permease [Clostridium omnivorum]|uniref:Binding-protein-dependent transport systems inner membrane component n=1 Tax=Clostridium omnivorum TaxID=1604902 RepID=A0ABQ5N2N5_9CLOT|nr:sugar ABC transporter permease [Clostridium sp. E14]GLC29441.1 binding-protein-dependent transport systems inner membrane component [Clostridium sp. E14]
MKKSRLDKIGMALFLIPAIVLFVTFFIYPVGYVAFTSFTKWDGVGAREFVGLKNYKFLFTDDVFLKSIKNNVIWALAGGFIQVPLAIIVAMLLSKKPRGWKIFRTIFYFPNIISGLALAMMWLAIFNSEYGALNALLKAIGLGNLQKNWLGDMNTAFPVMIIYWLFYIGYFMVIIMADISSIPESYYEAAEIDGASTFKQDLYITLPLIKGSITTCLTLALIYGLRQFENVYLMTNGGPDNNTSVMVLYIFKEFGNMNYGLANAAGVVLILVGSIVIVTVRKVFKA